MTNVTHRRRREPEPPLGELHAGCWRYPMLSRTLTLGAAAILVIAGCSQNDVSNPNTTDSAVPTTTTTTTLAAIPPESEEPDSVDVTVNSFYRSGQMTLAAVDVYYSTEAVGGPVVVLFHGGFEDKTSLFYPRLATAIAERGAVVFVPDWEAEPPLEPVSLSATFDGAICAASYALANAAEYGADPETLVLVGHSGGANGAAMAGVRDATPIDDCAVEMTPFVADRMVLVEGDWMLGGAWEDTGNLPELMEVSTPWTWLADAPTMPVTLVTTAGAQRSHRTCGVADAASPFWVRDPDGWFREQLDELKALDDDCIDIGEAATVLAAAMTGHGFDATELLLEDSGHAGFSDTDQVVLVDAILGTTDG